MKERMDLLKNINLNYPLIQSKIFKITSTDYCLWQGDGTSLNYSSTIIKHEQIE